MGSVGPDNFVPSQFTSDPCALHLARDIVNGNRFTGPDGDEVFEGTDDTSCTTFQNTYPSPFYYTYNIINPYTAYLMVEVEDVSGSEDEAECEVTVVEGESLVLEDKRSKASRADQANGGPPPPTTLYVLASCVTGKGDVDFWIVCPDDGETYNWQIIGTTRSGTLTSGNNYKKTEYNINPGEYTLKVTKTGGYERKIDFVVIRVTLSPWNYLRPTSDSISANMNDSESVSVDATTLPILETGTNSSFFETQQPFVKGKWTLKLNPSTAPLDAPGKIKVTTDVDVSGTLECSVDDDDVDWDGCPVSVSVSATVSPVSVSITPELDTSDDKCEAQAALSWGYSSDLGLSRESPYSEELEKSSGDGTGTFEQSFSYAPLSQDHIGEKSERAEASANLTPSSGSSTTTLSNMTKGGNYVIKARCGSSDTGDSITVIAVEVAIKNPVNPNKGQASDSDDYFFRGPAEPDVKVYYDFLPSGLTATSTKLLIKEGGSVLRQITLSTSSGTNLLAEWDGKDPDGQYYNKWDFRAVIEVVIEGQTCTSDEHPIADLLYKHRPLMYTHANELSGPQDVNCMMDYADLYIDKVINEKVDSAPLCFDDLKDANDATDRFQHLADSKHQVNEKPNVIYCRGTINSNYIFLQYWHFEPSSSVPESTSVFHEGDWEMFQIAVEPNTTAKELQPIAVTASQHYYGQTIRWDSNGFDNGPSSVDQDYVGKSGHQPKVYIARNAHATYFRQGEIGVSTWPPCTTANHGAQYNPTAGTMDEAASNPYHYTLAIFHDNMLSHWYGLWGAERWGVPPPYAFSDDGPPSPRYRETAVELWNHPKEFHNYYLKLKSYPGGAYAHPELEIP